MLLVGLAQGISKIAAADAFPFSEFGLLQNPDATIAACGPNILVPIGVSYSLLCAIPSEFTLKSKIED